MSLVTYLAICPDGWGRGTTQASALRGMNKMRKALTRVSTGIYRFVGEGHERACVDEAGHIRFPVGVQYEVVDTIIVEEKA